MGFIASAASSVVNFVGDVVETAVDFVGNVVESAVNVISDPFDDPLATVMLAAAVYTGYNAWTAPASGATIGGGVAGAGAAPGTYAALSGPMFNPALATAATSTATATAGSIAANSAYSGLRFLTSTIDDLTQINRQLDVALSFHESNLTKTVRISFQRVFDAQTRWAEVFFALVCALKIGRLTGQFALFNPQLVFYIQTESQCRCHGMAFHGCSYFSYFCLIFFDFTENQFHTFSYFFILRNLSILVNTGTLSDT